VVFNDVDGSLGGAAGGPTSHIVLDTGIAAAADDKDCKSPGAGLAQAGAFVLGNSIRLR
jgi:hypothetical protein